MGLRPVRPRRVAFALLAVVGLSAPAMALDFADGLMGGPDVWAVAGVPPGDALNLRAEPSAKSPILARFANGTLLTNQGCVLRGRQRWCKVSRHAPPPGQPAPAVGWVNGRYLREASF